MIDPEQWKMRLDCLRVPAKFREVEESVVLPASIAEWAGTPWAVTILGPAGTGKTWLAVRMLCGKWGKAATDGFKARHLRPRFVDVSISMTTIRRQFGSPDDGREFDSLVDAECLLLDDIGAERETDFTRDQLSLILRARYNAVKPTILTSNALNLQAIGEQRIASRLSEGIVITLDSKDRRARK